MSELHGRNNLLRLQLDKANRVLAISQSKEESAKEGEYPSGVCVCLYEYVCVIAFSIISPNLLWGSRLACLYCIQYMFGAAPCICSFHLGRLLTTTYFILHKKIKMINHNILVISTDNDFNGPNQEQLEVTKNLYEQIDLVRA